MAVGSIVDYLNSIGQNSSYANRSQLAAQNGIKNYKGTAAQNTQLLNILKGQNSGTATQPSTTTGGTPTQATTPSPSANVTVGVGPGGATANGSASYYKTTNQRKYQSSDRVNSLWDNVMDSAYDIPDEYEMSDRVQNYQDKLSDVENSKPGDYQSQYTDKISSVLDEILNGEDFSYTGKDMMNDDLYKMYADQYKRNADLAMRDTMGNAAALSGGYGSSYAAAVGQQAYDNTMANMNDIALDLYNLAYQRYSDNRADRYNQMGVLQALENMDYGKYRDLVSDWQLDRNYYAGRYDTEFNRDYGMYRDQVADAENNRNFWAGLYDTEYDNDFGAYQSDVAESQWEQEFSHNKEMDAANLAIAQAQLQMQQEQWEMEKALAQAQAAGSGGGGSSGRSGRSGSKKKSSGSKSSKASGATKTAFNTDITPATILNAESNGATTEELAAMANAMNTNPGKYIKDGAPLTSIDLMNLKKYYQGKYN